MPELAIYILPLSEDPFYQLGSEFLGYDILANRTVPLRYSEELDEELLSSWIGAAKKFGFHCTVGDALEFAEKDVEEICEQLSWICTRLKPFLLTNFRLNQDFWAGEPVLVAGFDDESTELFHAAKLVATRINVLHTASPYFPRLLEEFSDYNEAYLARYGSPMVFENYSPHFTFASSIPDAKSRRDLSSKLSGEVIFSNSEYSLTVDRLHLARKREDGFFEVVHSYYLETGKKVSQLSRGGFSPEAFPPE